MAEEKKSDESKLQYEDVINIDEELATRKSMIEIALGGIDNTWTSHKTGDDKISVVYKQFADANVSTVRGETTHKGDLDIYYKYEECGYDDVYINVPKTDESCTEINIRKLIDSDHHIIYASKKSGFFMVSPRDFTYIKTRFKYTNYVFNNKKYKIVGNVGYSVADNHPFNVPVKKDHVRGKLIMNGYVLSQAEDVKDDTFKVCKILAMDPNGMIPTWVVNQFAPSKGMEVKQFAADWEYVKEVLKEREAKNWEKEHKPLFELNPKLMFIDHQKNQNENKENENDAENKENE